MVSLIALLFTEKKLYYLSFTYGYEMDMMHGFTYLYMKPILILQMVYIKCKIFQILYLWETNNTKLLQFVLLYGLTVKKNNYNNKLTHKYQMKLK